MGIVNWLRQTGPCCSSLDLGQEGARVSDGMVSFVQSSFHRSQPQSTPGLPELFSWISASDVAVTLGNSCFILEGRFSSMTGLQQDYCLDAEFVPMSNIEGYSLKTNKTKPMSKELSFITVLSTF